MHFLQKISRSEVSIFEVGPRDGLQNESQILSLDQRVQLIAKLLVAGLLDVEVGSFVRADRIPALAETGEVIKSLRQTLKNIRARLWAFVPNQKGFDDAVGAGVDGVSLFVAASDTFCRKNVNRSLAEQKTEVFDLLAQAQKQKRLSRVYLSTIVHCPYEGTIKPDVVMDLAADLLEAGATKVVLSDTTGHADPLLVSKLLERVAPQGTMSQYALHFHDTRGLALANVVEGLRWGITQFDSSIAGLGGCPYAPGASGNLATEDLANLLDRTGLLTEGLSMPSLVSAGFYVEKCFARKSPSKVLRTYVEKI